MKTLYGITVGGLVLLLTAAPCAEAAEASRKVDGNRVLQDCSEALRGLEGGSVLTEGASFRIGFCQGYVLGALEMHMAIPMSISYPGCSVSHPAWMWRRLYGWWCAISRPIPNASIGMEYLS